jgi:hypothetical protein
VGVAVRFRAVGFGHGHAHGHADGVTGPENFRSAVAGAAAQIPLGDQQ